MIATDRLKHPMWWPASPHVILRMNLKKAALPSLLDDNCDVLMLKAGTCKTVNCWKASRHDCERRWIIHRFHVVSPLPAFLTGDCVSVQMGFSEPCCPFG